MDDIDRSNSDYKQAMEVSAKAMVQFPLADGTVFSVDTDSIIAFVEHPNSDFMDVIVEGISTPLQTRLCSAQLAGLITQALRTNFTMAQAVIVDETKH